MSRYQVLDACCGSKMFWFDNDHQSTVFSDCRYETHELKDASSKGGSRMLHIRPGVIADFTALPFYDETFSMVIFDPPHFMRNGKNGWMAKKYGTLNRETWQGDLRRGFRECFRVCKPFGTVLFKWNENEVPVAKVIHLSGREPLIGNWYGKHHESVFLAYLKD